MWKKQNNLFKKEDPTDKIFALLLLSFRVSHLYLWELFISEGEKVYWKWLAFISAFQLRNQREKFMDYHHYNALSPDETQLWKHFPLEANKRQTPTILYLFSPLTFPFVRDFHGLAFESLQIRKITSTEFLCLWKHEFLRACSEFIFGKKLRCASYSLATCPLTRFLVVPPSQFPQWLICFLKASCVGLGLWGTSVRVHWPCWVCFPLLCSSVV